MSSTTTDPLAPGAAAPGTTPLQQRLAGHHLLVVTDRTDTLQQVRASLQGSGMWIDHADSAGSAWRYCSHGAPQALMLDTGLDRAGLDALRRGLASLDPPVVTIELIAGDAAPAGRAPGRARALRLPAHTLQSCLAPMLATALDPPDRARPTTS